MARTHASIVVAFLVLACTNAPGGGEGSTTGTETGGELAMCGGPDALTCPAGTYCDDKACEMTGRLAECLPLPTDCEPGDRQVCGCDGQLHDSPCAAIQASGQSWCWDGEACGFDITSQIVCELPPGTFPCGNFFCDVTTEFCDRWVCLAGTQVSRCAPLPDGCGDPPDCACIEAVEGPFGCTMTPEGGFVHEESYGPDGCPDPPID
jgi:hypothetical protein